MTHHCGACGRKLTPKQWVFSKFTGARFCLPGGCKKRKKAKA